MLLRRITKHVKEQNWFAVGIDFIIVIVGVFIGIQVANWNDAQSDEHNYQNAMVRLAEENFETLDQLEEYGPTVEERIAEVQAAIVVLRTCETGSGAEATLNNGLNIIRGSSTPQAATLTLDQLVNDGDLLARQNTTIRTVLREYHEQLHEMNQVARLVGGVLSPPENDRHPLIGFTEVFDPSESYNGVDVRRAQINAPLAVACKDNSLAKQFYEWERSQVYQIALAKRMEKAITEAMETLDLVRPLPQGGEE